MPSSRQGHGRNRDRRPNPLQEFKASYKEATDLLSELEARLNRAQIINPLMEKIWLEIYEFWTILRAYERVRYYPDDIQKFLDKLEDKNARYANAARKMKEGFEKEKMGLKEALTKALHERLSSYMAGGNLIARTRFDKSDPLIKFSQRAYEILGARDAVYADKVLTIWEKMWEAMRLNHADKMIGGWKTDLKNLWDTVHRGDQSEQAIMDAQEDVKLIESVATRTVGSLQREESRNAKDMKVLHEDLARQMEQRPPTQSKQPGQHR